MRNRLGLGLSLLPRAAVARDLDAGTLAVIATPFTPISRPWHLVCPGVLSGKPPRAGGTEGS